MTIVDIHPYGSDKWWDEKDAKDAKHELAHYSKSFLDLYAVACGEKNASRNTKIKYRLVGTYLFGLHRDSIFNMSYSDRRWEQLRQQAVDLTTRLTEEEWQLVLGRMHEHLTNSRGSPAWIKNRKDWIGDLDLVRIFNNCEIS
jgi:hypothetical protein